MEKTLSRRRFFKEGGMLVASLLTPPFLKDTFGNEGNLYQDFSSIQLKKKELYADGEDNSLIEILARDFRFNKIDSDDLKVLLEAEKGMVFGRLVVSYGGLRKLDYFLFSPTISGYDRLKTSLTQKSSGKTATFLLEDILYKPSHVAEADSKFISKIVLLNGQKIDDNLTLLNNRFHLSNDVSIDFVLREGNMSVLYLMVLNRKNNDLVCLIKDSGLDGLYNPRILKFPELGDVSEFEDLVLFNDKYSDITLRDLFTFLGSRGEKTDYGIFLRDIIRKFWDEDFIKPKKYLDMTVFDPQINLGRRVKVNTFMKFKNYGTESFAPRELTFLTDFPELNSEITTNFEEPIYPRETKALNQLFEYSDETYHDQVSIVTKIVGTNGEVYVTNGLGKRCSDCSAAIEKEAVPNNSRDPILLEILKFHKK